LTRRLNPIAMKRLFAVLGFLGVSAFDFSGLDAEQRSIEVPRIGSDVNVTCGGKEITIQISPLYVRRNSKWLRDGTFLRILFTNQHFVFNHVFILFLFLPQFHNILVLQFFGKLFLASHRFFTNESRTLFNNYKGLLYFR
jgi:hypothetical protein